MFVIVWNTTLVVMWQRGPIRVFTDLIKLNNMRLYLCYFWRINTFNEQAYDVFIGRDRNNDENNS
jgi:hypothetical protein